MDFRWIAKRMGILSNARETLIKSGVSAEDLKWVDFTDMESVWRIAQKIIPTLFKNNPQFKQIIQNTNLLDWEQKKQIIDMGSI